MTTLEKVVGLRPGFIARRRVRKQCFHHNRTTGESFVKSRLIDLGRRKMFWCTKCERTWFT